MRSLVMTLVAVCVSSVLVGCSGGDRPATSDNSNLNGAGDVATQDDSDAAAPNACDTDHVGCPCYNEGASFDCGRVHRHSGTYETCTEGKSTCTNGFWGPCEGWNIVGAK